jgi:hypothetical protein
MDGWTDRDNVWRELYYGESIYDPRDEPDEEEPAPVRTRVSVMATVVRVVSCADCGQALVYVMPGQTLPPPQALAHACPMREPA